MFGFRFWRRRKVGPVVTDPAPPPWRGGANEDSVHAPTGKGAAAPPGGGDGNAASTRAPTGKGAETPLHRAVRRKTTDVAAIAALIGAGVKPDARNPSGETPTPP